MAQYYDVVKTCKLQGDLPNAKLVTNTEVDSKDERKGDPRVLEDLFL